MIRSFAELSTKGVGDPSVLSGAIGAVLIASYFGLLASLVGCVLLSFAIWRHGFKSGWALGLFAWSVIPSLLALWMTCVLVLSAMHPPDSHEAQRTSEVGSVLGFS
jgi:NADH:ubiquinone oxidoreductase subunit 6 (subunit J)